MGVGPLLFDRVKETTTTTGTGTLTLAGAASGYQGFSAVGDGNSCFYCVADQTGTDWEVGLGTYTAAGTTLSRDTVLASSNAGGAVNFPAGTKDVFLTMPAALPAYLNPSAAYASLASLYQGRLGFPSDGFHLLRDSGSAWVPWGPLFPMTLPVDGNYAWVNQGTATVSATKGGVYLQAPTGTGDNMRIRKKAAPATPYKVRAAMLGRMAITGSPRFGLCFRQSSDGKLVSFAYVANGGAAQVFSNKMASPTSFASQYFAHDTPDGAQALVWMQIADDGVNRVCSLSSDGQNWIDVHSVTRTDYLTADEVGFWCDSQSTDENTGVTLLSWKEL